MEFKKLEQYLKQMESRFGIPALDVRVAKAGETIYKRQSGFSDLAKTQPAGDADIFIGYSSTKVFTSAALALLLDEGKLDLDDPVAKYLPAYQNLEVYVRDDEGRIVGTHPVAKERPMLIRHVATMTGGLGVGRNSLAVAKAISEGRRSTQDIVNAYAKDPLLFEPGDYFKYGNCLDTAAAVMEVVSGMKFAELIDKRFCKPLGLKDTTFHPTPEQNARISQQYFYDDFRGLYPVANAKGSPSDEYESGGGGIYYTIDDYMKFANMLAAGGKGADGTVIMRPQAIEIMRRPLLTPQQKRGFDRMKKPGYSYGLGVRTMVNPEAYGLKTPVGEFGWDSAGNVYVSICPEEQLVIFYGVQILNFIYGYEVIHPTVRELVYQELEA